MKPWDIISSIRSRTRQRGRIPLILLWILGVPLPILFIIFLIRGCS